VNPFPFEPAREPDTDDIPRVVPHTDSPGGPPVAFTTLSSWDRGYVALDSKTRGIFIVAAALPEA
jgi:hypothetical protein